ncbi:TatD family hydrolase [Methanocaldococcus sp.]
MQGEKLIITDNHAHVDNSRGLGAIKVAKTFYNAGGRVLILLNKPTFDGNLTRSMDILVKDIEKINKETNVKAFGLVGVHPAELTYLSKYMPLEEAKEKIIKAIDYASSLIERYDFLVGIGEVGRPHYEVDEKILKISNEILLYCMEKAKDLDSSIQIHAESSTEEQFKEFSEMAKKVGLNPERVVKHHCGDMVLEGEKYGIFPSILANRVNEDLVKKSLRFVMETDYIDDLKRPGAVLGIKTVPRITKKLLDRGIIDEDGVYKIHKENIEKIYKINLGG